MIQRIGLLLTLVLFVAATFSLLAFLDGDRPRAAEPGPLDVGTPSARADEQTARATVPPHRESGKVGGAAGARRTGRVRVGSNVKRLDPFDGDGQLLVRNLRIGAETLHRLPIAAGAWGWPSFFEPTDLVAIDRLLLGGEVALPLHADYRPIGPSNDPAIAPTIDALWAGMRTFLVVDDATGRPLDDVEVRYSATPSPWHARVSEGVRQRAAIESGDTLALFEGVPMPAPRGPAATDRLLASSTGSPVAVPDCGLLGTYWIASPGFERIAWPTADTTPTTTAEVRLRRAGTLNARVESPHLLADANTSIELWPTEGSTEPSVRAPLPIEGRVRFEDLAGGRIEARLTVRDDRNRTRILDRATAEVAPGRETSVVLSANAPNADLAILDGHLFIEHDRPDFLGPRELHLQRDGETKVTTVGLSPVSRDATTSYARLDTTWLSAGRYSIVAQEVEDLAFEWSVDLDVGQNLLELEIHDLRERRLLVLDPATGERLQEPVSLTLGIHTDLTGERPDALASSVETLVSTSGALRLPLPAGRVDVSARSARRGVHWTRLEIPRGGTELAVELPVKPCATIRLSVDGVETAVTPEWLAAVAAYDVRGERVAVEPTWDWAGSALPSSRLWFHEPGSYELRPPGSFGLPPLEPMHVTVSSGQTADVLFAASTVDDGLGSDLDG